MSLENLSIEARDELAAHAQQLADNPETRKEFLKMTKKVKPEIPIPELDIEEKTTMAVNRAEQRVQELEAKLKQKDALEELHRRRQAIVKKGLASEDDIEGIEKLTLEKKIADHETAAQYHEWMKQAAEPTPSGYNPNVMRKWNLDAYRVNPVTAARDEAVKALGELRKPTRPIGL